jgi:hypothetical protein
VHGYSRDKPCEEEQKGQEKSMPLMEGETKLNVDGAFTPDDQVGGGMIL